MEQEQKSVLERHIQSAIGVVLVGLVAWVGLSINQQGASIAALNERVSNLQDQIVYMRDDLRERTVSRYSKDDAKRDLAVINDRINSLEGRRPSLSTSLPIRHISKYQSDSPPPH